MNCAAGTGMHDDMTARVASVYWVVASLSYSHLL